MELGNVIFGHSRGSFEIPREKFENEIGILFTNFLKLIGLDDRGYPDTFINEKYKTENISFDNNVFTIRPYYWGIGNKKLENAPNFLYKPENIEIRWYKYPFRDSYCSCNISLKKFKEIIEKCKKSIL